MRFSTMDPLGGLAPENVAAAIEALKKSQFIHTEFRPELGTS